MIGNIEVMVFQTFWYSEITVPMKVTLDLDDIPTKDDILERFRLS